MHAMSSKSPKHAKGDGTATAKSPSKSAAIKRAHKKLIKALAAHAEIAVGSGVSIKKAQRAGAAVAVAAAAYADATQAKTGLENPFVPGNGMLAGETIQSLKAERSMLEQAATSEIPTISASSPAADLADLGASRD